MKDISQLAGRIEGWMQKSPAITKKAIAAGADLVIGRSQSVYLTAAAGDTSKLHVRSGRLRRSIHKDVTITGRKITATIGSNVKYARIHELGGGINVKARGQLVLRGWRVESGLGSELGGESRFATLAQARTRLNRPFAQMVLLGAHTINMPARPYLSTALRDKRPEMLQAIRDHLFKLWREEGMRG